MNTYWLGPDPFAYVGRHRMTFAYAMTHSDARVPKTSRP